MTDDLRQEYLNKHLPYRLNSLMAHDMMLYRKKLPEYAAIKDSCYGDSLVVEPAFEISPIFGRSLLNFLGLGLDNANFKINRRIPRGTDYSIKNLFPERDFCPENDPIITAHNTNLATLYKIYDLTLKYIPEINKQKIWWHTQVDKK
jgi:hypothetical protein